MGHAAVTVILPEDVDGQMLFEYIGQGESGDVEGFGVFADSVSDWWRFGGRYDGEMLGLEPLDDGGGGFNFDKKFSTLERNLCYVSEIADGFMPSGFYAPTGERFQHAFRRDDPQYERAWNDAREKCKGHVAVLVDAHSWA